MEETPTKSALHHFPLRGKTIFIAVSDGCALALIAHQNWGISMSRIRRCKGCGRRAMASSLNNAPSLRLAPFKVPELYATTSTCLFAPCLRSRHWLGRYQHAARQQPTLAGRMPSRTSLGPHGAATTSMPSLMIPCGQHRAGSKTTGTWHLSTRTGVRRLMT